MSAVTPLWTPSQQRVDGSRLKEFEAYLLRTRGLSFTDYAQLHRWSIEESAEFWQAVWDFTEVLSSVRASVALSCGEQFPGARWFEGARLNYAENLLRHESEAPAIVSILENGERRVSTWSELRAAVACMAASLRSHGVKCGDRVAGVLPNSTHTVIAMLATASLGAVWSSCSPDFGVNGILDRFGQIAPKVLFACDGYFYGGKVFDCQAKVDEVAGKLTSLAATVMVPILGDELWVTGAYAWESFLYGENSSSSIPIYKFVESAPAMLDSEPDISRSAPELTFEQLPFDHPLFIMFSSGTTGAPKCIVHGAGGTLLQHLKEQQLHVGLRPDDVLSYFTTCGWMMWNWLVSGLASGATLVLYDGSPFHVGSQALFDLVDAEGINVLGVGAKYISAIEKAGLRPKTSHQLTTLRTILSTGSPLLPQSFRYVYAEVKSDVCLSSISGGTDIISCFLLGNECLPVFEGEIQCPGLGMAVEVLDDGGAHVIGKKGELVCTKPFPSAPIGFWNDADGSRYLNAYFSSFPGVWAQGDFAEVTHSGGLIIHGRSDAVLNPGGVRIGTAEIYRQVESFNEVTESICVGQEWENDVRVVLFVVLRKGLILDDELTKAIRQRIRQETTPRHVPAKIVQVQDIPKTQSGKIAEIAVRDVVNGKPVENLSSLSNPEALEYYQCLETLAR